MQVSFRAWAIMLEVWERVVHATPGETFYGAGLHHTRHLQPNKRVGGSFMGDQQQCGCR